LDEVEYVLTASVGIATYPADGTDVTTLIKNADIAMYRAKEQGKNRFEHYSEKMSEANVQRLSLETQLKRAVQEGEQFLLEFQPKLRLSDQRICGFEALVRWRHPDRGVILPGEFVTLAEESGLIGRLGQWVLQKACAQAAQWHRGAFPDQSVAVNVTARELYSSGFTGFVQKVLSETGLPPNRLELEITETVMMRNVDQVHEVLTELKRLGVRLAVDDFGTGYSSLTYLKRFPLDTVKIDRSFIRNIPDDADDLAISRAVIAMAHSLRVKVVAEGVENGSQLFFLTELGCDEVQGILVSPPLPGVLVPAFLETHPPEIKRFSIVR
jgi:EAL domain-containing protein (putative c-di-GMP-specific phosphodiesterase class I)